MRIDRFGLGDWWPRPQQAAAGALDHLPPDQWPMLAARWLAAGFDSQSLRQFAQLQTGESPASLRADRRSSSRRGGLWAQPVGAGQPVPAEVQRLQRWHRAALDAMELMPEVLRSLGFDPAPARRGVRGPLPERAGYRAARPGRHRLRPVSDAGAYRRGMALECACEPCRTARTGAGARACPVRCKVPGCYLCGRLGLRHAQGDTRDRVAGVRRPRRSSGVDLGRRGPR